MADAPVDPEKFEEQLKADMAAAKAEYEAILATKDQADKEYWQGIKRIASEAFKLPESYSSKIEKYKSDALFLNQAAEWAGEHNYQALAAADLFSLNYDIGNEGKEAQGKSVVDYPKNLDLAVENWLFEWTTSNKQIELEKLLLGDKVSQPEPMSIGERNGKIFQNPDENWQNIQNILKGEARAREQIVESFQRVVLTMAGKTLVHHGPSEAAVASYSGQLTAAKKKLEKYQETYQERLKQMAGQGVAPEYAEFQARTQTFEEFSKLEKKQPEKEQVKTTPALPVAVDPEKFEEQLKADISNAKGKPGSAEKAVAGKVVKKGLGTVIKATLSKAKGWLATRLALLLAPTGGSQVALLILLAKDVIVGGLKLVKNLIVNKTVRDYVLAAGVTGMILLKMLFDVILASAWTGAFSVLGFFVGGIPGAAIGAFVGYTVGPTLSSAMSSLLGGGTTATATTATTTTVSSAGMMAGGGSAGLFSTGIVTSLGGAASTVWSAISAAATSGSFVVVSSVIAVGAVQIIDQMRINSIFAQQPPPPEENTATGKSFSIQKTVNPTFVPGGTTAQVIYTVTISANENISGITVADKFTRENKTGSQTLPALVPEQPWPTSMAKGETKTIKLKAYTVTTLDANSNLVNRITVSTNAESLSAEATATVGNPDYTASRCQIAPAGNACSPNQTDMVKYFGSDPTIVNNASRICYAESHGNIMAINDACTKNLSYEKMREYSVGLFQINLWAHSSLCLQVEGVYENPFKYPYKSGCVYPQCTPCLGRNQDLLDVCAEYWMRPENNIRYAWELSNHGTDWYPDWSTAGPTVCNIP